MPYIRQDLRHKLDEALHQLEYISGLTPGELNYFITKLLLEWVKGFESYARYSTARGVLQDVADELYRKRVAPYEDMQCAGNGEVY